MADQETVHSAEQRAGDRVWAWIGAVLAAAVSIAVNTAHAAPVSWGFAAFAAVLPLMVLISTEQMARRLLGAATWPVMLVVGLCAYSLSFWHAVLLLGHWGEPWPLRITGAVAVDGLAVGSVVALYRAGRRVEVAPVVAAAAAEVTPTPAPAPTAVVVETEPEPAVAPQPRKRAPRRPAASKRDAALAALAEHPDKSNMEIARLIGSDARTVSRARKPRLVPASRAASR